MAASRKSREPTPAPADGNAGNSVAGEGDTELKVIKHEGDKWILYTSDGSKKLGEFDSEDAAKKRERQIEFFKRQGKAINLDNQSSRVRDAYMRENGRPGEVMAQPSSPWPEEVWDDHILIQLEDGLYRIPWSENVDGEIEFGDPVKVEMREVEVKALKPGYEETENQIRYRVANPDQFEEKSFRVMDVPGVEGIQFVLAKKPGEDTTSVQAVHFDKAKWDMTKAKKWVSDHPALKGESSEGSAGNDKDEEDKKNISSFKSFKQADGRIRYVQVVSNNFRDQDTPPEILAAESHQRYVKAVDEGKYPYPILCPWHEKSLKVGQADWIDYAEDEGMLVVSGLIDKDKEDVIARLDDLSEEFLPLGSSHEFKALRKDNESVVTLDYTMTETSFLPRKWAANSWTSFGIVSKEKDMPLHRDKKGFLGALIGEEEADAFEQTLKDLASGPIGAGIERKSADDDSSGDETGSESASATADGGASEPDTGQKSEPPEVVVVENADGSHSLAQLVEEPEDEEGEAGLKDRLDASETNLKELAELIVQVAEAVKEIRTAQGDVPTMVTKAVADYMATLPRATKYRATQEPENVVQKAKKAVGEVVDGDTLPGSEERGNFWDQRTRNAFSRPTKSLPNMR